MFSRIRSVRTLYNKIAGSDSMMILESSKLLCTHVHLFFPIQRCVMYQSNCLHRSFGQLFCAQFALSLFPPLFQMRIPFEGANLLS